MTLQNHAINNISTYETSELKLAALILSEILNCSFEINEQENSARKVISVKFPTQFKNEINQLEKNFINKQASTNVYRYNKALNQIRDRLRGKDERIY